MHLDGEDYVIMLETDLLEIVHKIDSR